MQEDEFKALLKKYTEGRATDEEIALVEDWYAKILEDKPYSLEERAAHANEVWAALQPVLAERKTRALWPRIAAAALLILSLGGYFLWPKAPAPQQVAQKIDIAPGNQSAILQLSNGEQIALNSVKNGAIATQGKTTITKTNNQLIYNGSTEELIYNTVTTKRGNFYPLTLSDGTLAILDAGSSIRYPVAFVGNERRVEITGQVYFEVKHNEKMPFRVSVKGQTIEDIGTAFNVNAYDDEPNIKTTLIEGSIKINNKTLVPGQQAVISNGNVKVEQADTEQAIAWKNGRFSFNRTPLSEGMRQLSRWYDVDIEYPEGIPNTYFAGGINRNTKASEVLEILSFSKVHFQIVQGSNGKKILVKP